MAYMRIYIINAATAITIIIGAIALRSKNLSIFRHVRIVMTAVMPNKTGKHQSHLSSFELIQALIIYGIVNSSGIAPAVQIMFGTSFLIAVFPCFRR